MRRQHVQIGPDFWVVCRVALGNQVLHDLLCLTTVTMPGKKPNYVLPLFLCGMAQHLIQGTAFAELFCRQIVLECAMDELNGIPTAFLK